MSVNNLAHLYHLQGRYAEAEPLYQRALAIDKNALGPDIKWTGFTPPFGLILRRR